MSKKKDQMSVFKLIQARRGRLVELPQLIQTLAVTTAGWKGSNSVDIRRKRLKLRGKKFNEKFTPAYTS